MKMKSLVLLVGVLGAISQGAVRQPVGIWDFDPADPNIATLGADLGFVGTVQPAAGVTAEDTAVLVGVGSHFVCRHGIEPNGGGAMVNQWTILVDFRYPAASVGKYIDILQTDPENSPGNDSDWTVASSDGAIGIAAVGYSRQTGFYTQPDTWYRMVMPVHNGARHDLFVDGQQVLVGNQQGIDGRFALADRLLLFAASDGDDNDIIVSRVAVWDVPLTAGEIMALGDPNYGLYHDNAGPDVRAGADQELEMDESGVTVIALDGTVVDDGAYTVEWKQISGPTTLVIGDPASEDTVATITTPGKYVLQLTADDGQFQLSDTVTFVVHPFDYRGLIVHWNFDQTWDGLTVQDVSSHENHGRVMAGIGQAAYIADGVHGQALDLPNGAQKSVGDCIALDMVLPNSGTIALWFKPHQFYNYNSVFDNSVQQDDWEMWIYNDGRVRFRVEAGTEVTANLTQLAQGQNPLALWWHMTLTWNRLTATTVTTQMYINGSLAEQKTGPWVNPGATFYLGGGHPGNTYAYGAVDDFRIYNRALTASEALDLVFGENVPPEVNAGPDQEFEMDEASTPIVVALDGTITDTGEIITAWSKIAGPNDITIENAHLEDATATISAPGRYTLQLTVDDGEYVVSDTLLVVVHPHGYDGRILHWDFETGSGSQVIDVSGHSSHGTIIDGAIGSTRYTAGKMGRCLEFLNGDYAAGGDHVAVDMRLPDNGTIALWYNPHALYNYNAIFDNSCDADDWEMWIYDYGTVRFRVDDTAIVSADLYALSPAENPSPVGKWWHIAVTWQRMGETVALKMFVNGAQIDQVTGPWIDPGQTFQAGGGHPGNDYAHGLMDELYIYDRPLDMLEVLGLMYRGNKPPIVDAGPDIVRWLDASGQLSVQLQGYVTDDGGPSDLLVSWTKISGPNDIIIDDPSRPDSWAAIAHAGIYNLRIDANDGEFYSADDMFIEVYPAGYTGLIAHWPFDSDTLEDVGGRGNHGVLVDGPASESGYAKGKLGRAWRPGNGDFATGGDYVSLRLTMPDAGTIAFWYQVNNLYNYATLFDNSVQQDDWEMWIYDRGEARFRIQAGGEVSANLHALSSDGDARGDWFHFAATWKRLSPTTVENSLYVNGQLIQSRVGPWVDPGTTFYLGGGNDGNDYADGLWDDVRLYERTLSLGEIRLLASMSNFDGDQDVDAADLRILGDLWLHEVPDCVSTSPGDFNMDCRVDIQDFAAFARWWLESLD
ncbi:MAG: LamG domain-containing protein [Phycisphaerae bacterium]|nr:LamG domain-containing protein [Phycisphaerae bacterium]